MKICDVQFAYNTAITPFLKNLTQRKILANKPFMKPIEIIKFYNEIQFSTPPNIF